MLRAKYGVCALCLALAGFVPGAGNAQDKSPLSQWKSDKALTKQLAPFVKVDAYGVQPPQVTIYKRLLLALLTE